jgi:lysophospholipase L1-like esterase
MKIVGNTVGMGLPKPNLKQTDPSKGDFVKGKDEIPVKTSQLENDSGYLTEVPEGYAKTADIPKVPADIGAQPAGNYALKTEIPSVPVQSVNGKTGAVTLGAADVGARPSSWMPSASDVGALPASTTIPTKVSQLTNDKGYITGYTETDPTVPSWAKASSKPSYNKSEVGLGNVGNVRQYSASNPPPYPVTSVNGKTGAVTVDVPTKVSQLTNDKGYLTEHQDISGKLDASALPSAINTALAQAKASGEFDGTDGKDGADARIVAQTNPPSDTSVLWVDTSDEESGDGVFANPLYGKKITLNGDSICAGAGYAGGYGKIIADRNSMAYQNIAVGGATITAETYSGSTGKPLHWICRTISDMDANADYAIVEGGVNDPNYVTNKGSISSGFTATLNDTTFYGAFESMLKQLIERFPGKKIGYIAVHKFSSNFDSRSTGNYYHIAKECCEKWGVPFCDLNTTVPPFGDIPSLSSVYTMDGDHPNEQGYRKYYCDKIEAWLKTL